MSSRREFIKGVIASGACASTARYLVGCADQAPAPGTNTVLITHTGKAANILRRFFLNNINHVINGHDANQAVVLINHRS